MAGAELAELSGRGGNAGEAELAGAACWSGRGGKAGAEVLELDETVASLFMGGRGGISCAAKRPAVTKNKRKAKNRFTMPNTPYRE